MSKNILSLVFVITTTIINGKIKMKSGKILGDPEGLPLNF